MLCRHLAIWINLELRRKWILDCVSGEHLCFMVPAYPIESVREGTQIHGRVVHDERIIVRVVAHAEEIRIRSLGGEIVEVERGCWGQES